MLSIVNTVECQCCRISTLSSVDAVKCQQSGVNAVKCQHCQVSTLSSVSDVGHQHCRVSTLSNVKSSVNTVGCRCCQVSTLSSTNTVRWLLSVNAVKCQHLVNFFPHISVAVHLTDTMFPTCQSWETGAVSSFWSVQMVCQAPHQAS